MDAAYCFPCASPIRGLAITHAGTQKHRAASAPRRSGLMDAKGPTPSAYIAARCEQEPDDDWLDWASLRAPILAPEPDIDMPLAIAAPVLTIVRTATRPTCERCGQVFRKSGAGLAWHVANRPDCARPALSIAS